MNSRTEACFEDVNLAAADALRFLAADAVELAKSGHPGAPLGMAEMAEALWRKHLKHNPNNPHWPDRDRFVLSNGHASALLYALLHLTGYDLSIADLMRFRQLHSKTPGHPEVDVTPGVETTTGPLGQGLANAVGMALAEQQLARQFNRPEHAIIDHFTYVFCGDGCLMEGISHEVCSLAGTLKLGKLICLYDDNGISIDGEVSGWFSDDTARRFEAYGWHVVRNVDGHDLTQLDTALQLAKQESNRPSLICCKTVIGQGAPSKAGSHDVHGSPLGVVELQSMREKKGWNTAPFEIPQTLKNAWDARQQGAALEQAWQAQFASYRQTYPDLAQEFLRRLRPELPEQFAQALQALTLTGSKAEFKADQATRRSSQLVLEKLVAGIPELFGGSADLTGSNLTAVAASHSLNKQEVGNYLSYGVREFGMAAIMNGMALHGGFIPYAGTFLTFSDYSRNAIRMAALMKRRVIHVLSHDSIGLGEDGPTHQPVEHVSSLRIIPNNRVWRPCDGVETAYAWKAAIEREDGPTCLILSRQNLPQFERQPAQLHDIECGGYVLREMPDPRVVLIATGSEVAIAAQAQQELARLGIASRLVSMPCVELFKQQTPAYQRAVLPDALPKISIEAGITWFWQSIVGSNGVCMGIDSFGESAPATQLYAHFKLTVDEMVKQAKKLLEVQA